MHIQWNDKDPIYRQLYDQFVQMILDGVFKDGDALPSLREISSQQRVNHITIAKALQMLVDEGLVEKRRGLGMFVVKGAVKKLARRERERFLRSEWPQIREKIDRLGLSIQFLLLSENKENEDK
jgi:GntR family transcriptional regulator